MRAASFWAQGTAVAAIVAAGCGDPPAPSGAGATTAGPATAAPASAAPAAANAKPPMKEFDETPQSKVGTLPPDTGIAPGQAAPDAAVHDADGKEVRIGDLAKKGSILLVFYRGGWCPYCNFEIHELTKAYPEYQKRGVTPVAISVDKQDEASKTQATYTIPFPVLSDPDLAAHRAFRVLHQAGEAEVAKLKGFGIDLEKSSGRAHHTFAIPALFLIDTTGKVRWAHADPDYKVRPRTPQILAAIDASGVAAR